MGGCSSQTKKPDGSAPGQQQQAHGGFGAPVHQDCQEEKERELPTGVPDMDLFHSLPPCEVAETIKSLHSMYGGKDDGQRVLENLYVAIRGLKNRAREDKHNRFLSLDFINNDPKAIKVANWAGFFTDPNDPTQLTAEDSNGAFVPIRNPDDFQVVLQYIEAMVGGHPDLPPGFDSPPRLPEPEPEPEQPLYKTDDDF